jgi:DNA segregation ATPase FtsK/SpoIIIE, S-DNA-T family
MPREERRKPRPTAGRPSTKYVRSRQKAEQPVRGKSRTKQSRSSKSVPSLQFMPRWKWRSISPERKLDILGIVVALVGLISLLSLISTERSSVTGLWVSILFRTAGWGAFILPLAFIFLGLWLVFRNIEKLPLLSPERLLGIILLYVNLLTWMHLFAGGGWAIASAGHGGGYIGGLFERILTGSLGKPAAIIVLAVWLMISLLLTFDISIPEFWRKLQPELDRLKSSKQDETGIQTQAGQTKNQPPLSTSETSASLPPNFQPLKPLPHKPNDPFPSQKPANASKLSGTQTTQNNPEGNPAEPASDQNQMPQAEETNIPPAPNVDWKLPALEEILDPPIQAVAQSGRDEDRAHLIEETLAAFGTPVHVVEIHRGPTVTQFGVEPDFVESRAGRMRVRVSKIVSLADDLALALAAPRIRIQAPVPGRNYVGIEVPNQEISRVSLREVIESEPFQKTNSLLRFALGKDVAGKPVAVDFTKLPHLLIAGTTGSGKSVCVNAILCCLLLDNTPNDLRLVLVDPKRVELTGYNGIPHLLAPVVVDAERVVSALQWMLREMDTRYHKFSQNGVRNIQEFNTRFPEQHLPYLVVVVDELADLMMLAPEETERSITRLAQLARATGIHLVLATQRPSVDVVTGLIKANFPARIAFAVASNVDSRVILDQPGAERLLGRGDMLYQAPDAPGPARLQGAYVSDHEINKLVDYWQQAARTTNVPSVKTNTGQIDSVPNGVPLRQVPLWSEITEEDNDPMLSEAIDLVRREGRASITMLQRRLRIGYTRAARMIDAMENKGIIGSTQPNSQVREVLDYGPTAPPSEEK